MSIAEQTKNKLDFNVIISELCDFAILPATKQNIKSLTPYPNKEVIIAQMSIAEEALTIIERSMRAPFNITCDYDYITSLLKKGALLTGSQLYETIRLYQTIHLNVKFANELKKNQIASTYFQSLTTKFYVNERLEHELVKSLDENGNVLDEASPLLKTTRKKILQLELNLKNKLQELVSKESGKLSQTNIVLRDNRYCLAVKSEYKNQIKGIIHDVSASMQTCFIEPQVAAQMMNEKAHLLEIEKAEVNRILKDFSQALQQEVEILQMNFNILKEIDFIFAKGLLAQKQNAIKPKINDTGILDLRNARHPLLKVKKVIPNNVSFGDGYLGIVITGPNTGGKTVLLKTVGLICLMTKYGLLIPADENSNVMIFDQIFCDIGDDQSIASNLSTFSSHMNNIKEIIERITPRSLVLFDEIGSGTDPVEGSNLAKAILKYLINEKVSFITTTHYSSLKAFAFENPNIINASMVFDEQSLSPTYKLKLGISGSSNAFNIARRLGLKSSIVEDATKMAKASNTDVNKLITSLEKKQDELDQKIIFYETSEANARKVQEEYQQKLNKLEKEKKQIILKAETIAKQKIAKLTEEALNIIEEARKLKNTDPKLHEIIEIKHKIDNLEPHFEQTKAPKVVDNQTLQIGDDVYLKSYDQYGTIQKILKDHRYEVAIGNISLTLDASEFSKVAKIQYTNDQNKNISFNKSLHQVALTLDLRGKRYEEAKDLLDKYLDDLAVAQIKQASIIHGYGTGVIRELVQNYLRSNKNVASFRYGGENEGGFGVTVITLK